MFLVFILFFPDRERREFFNELKNFVFEPEWLFKNGLQFIFKSLLIKIYGVEGQWFPPKHTLLLKCT